MKNYLLTRINKINNVINHISNTGINEAEFRSSCVEYERKYNTKGLKKYINEQEKITSYCYREINEDNNGNIEIVENIRIFTEINK